MPPREWSKRGAHSPRPRAVHQGKRRAARRETMPGNGTAAAKAARRRNKEHRFRKRFIRRNAWTEKVPPQESGESLGNKNPRRRLSPRQQRRAPENASGDGISAPLSDDATPPPDTRQARVQRGQRARRSRAKRASVGRKTTPERRWGYRLPTAPCIRENTARARAFKGDFVAVPQRCKVCDKNIESDTLSFKYVFVLFLQKARPQVPQIHAPAPDFQGGATFFPAVPSDPCRRRRDLAGTSRRTGSKRSNKLCGRFRHVPRGSKFAPRRAAEADLAMFMREGRHKSGDCGRSAASAGETAACRRQGTRVQTAPTAAPWRGRPTAAAPGRGRVVCARCRRLAAFRQKKPAESRASGGRTCRAKKISAASWRC